MFLKSDYTKLKCLNINDKPLFIDQPLNLFLNDKTFWKKKKLIAFFKMFFNTNSSILNFTLNYEQKFAFIQYHKLKYLDFCDFKPANYTMLYYLSLKATVGLFKIFRLNKGYRANGQSNRRPKTYMKRRLNFYKNFFDFNYNNFFNFYITAYFSDLLMCDKLSHYVLNYQHDTKYYSLTKKYI